MLKRRFEYITVGVLAAAVLAAAVYFALRLYSTPLQRRLSSQLEQLQAHSLGLQDGARDVAGGDFSALPKIKEEDAAVAAIIRRLRRQYTTGGLPAASVMPGPEMRKVLEDWDRTHKHAATLLAKERVLKGTQRLVDMLDRTADTLLAQSETIVQALVKQGVADRQVYFASRQITLIQRISRDLHELLRPAGWGTAFTSSPSYTAIVNDAAVFEHTLEAMLRGDARLGIAPVNDADMSGRLRENAQLFGAINRDIGQILAMVPDLQGVRRTTQALRASSGRLAQDSNALAAAVIGYRARHDAIFVTVYLVALGALCLLFVYGVYTQRAFRGQLDFNTAQNRRYKEIMSRLKPTLEQLARGEVAGRGIEAGDGMEGVIEPFNQAVAKWRDTMVALGGWTGQLAPLVERINTAAGNIAHDHGRQVEGTTTASATLNRLLPAMEALSSQAADALKAVEALAGDRAAAGGRPAETAAAEARTLTPAVGDDAEAQQIDGLIAQVALLTEGIEHLSAMVLHLLIRTQNTEPGGQPGQEPVPYANKALQVAHQCTEAVDGLNQGLARLRDESGRRTAASASPGESEVPQAAHTQDADERVRVTGARVSRIGDMLRAMPRQLSEQAAAVISVSDDMDKIHEYTMHASNETADVARSLKRVADLIEHIRRSVEHYDILE